MTTPNPHSREWLSLIPALMKQVRPRDYIWSMDPGFEAARQAKRARLRGFVDALRSIGIVVVTFLGLQAVGYRHVSPEQERTLAMVERLDPDHEVDEDRILAERWGKLPQVYSLVRSAEASAHSGEQYPYLTTLNGHPPPAVSPGNAPAVLLLVNALGFYPVADQARLIGRLLALAVAMDQPEIISAFEEVAKLPNDVRRRLFADRATSFARIVGLEQNIEAGETRGNEIHAIRSATLCSNGVSRATAA